MKLPKMYASEKERKEIDMTLSTNPLGCSPRAMKALRKISMQDISSYGHGTDLIETLGKKFSVNQNTILLGAGSEHLVKLIVQTFLREHGLACIQEGTFALFVKECSLKNASIRFFDPTSDKPKAPSASIIFLCNPNNPTGELLPKGFVREVAGENPRSIVIVDEANGEFMETSSIPLAKNFKNLIVLRTLSKAIGLAGLRIGIAITSPDLRKRLNDAQQVFPISTVSSKLACAALGDATFLEKTKRFIQKERKIITDVCLNLELSVSNSVTNNLFIMSPDSEEIVSELSRRGVGVISGNNFPEIKRKGFRIAIKSRQTNKAFLVALSEVVSCVRSKNLVR